MCEDYYRVWLTESLWFDSLEHFSLSCARDKTKRYLFLWIVTVLHVRILLYLSSWRFTQRPVIIFHLARKGEGTLEDLREVKWCSRGNRRGDYSCRKINHPWGGITESYGRSGKFLRNTTKKLPLPSPHPPGPRTVMNNKRYLKKVGCERTCTLIIFDSGNNKWFASEKVLFSNGEG